MIPRNTRREDRRALVEAGKRYHAAKLAYGYTRKWDVGFSDVETAYHEALRTLLHASECYAVGRRKASVEWGIRHYAKSTRA